MRKKKDIDQLLRDWPFQPGDVSARLIKAHDGREVLQMRVDLGLLQLEVDDRPDGIRPSGHATYYDYLRHLARGRHGQFEMNAEQCTAADREFLQFYHRRICWLSLREFHRAVRDADHSLALMDFVRAHSPDEDWTLSHEQYRPFVLFHRTQAATLARLQDDGPETALSELDAGLKRFADLFAQYEADEQFEDDELVQRLREMKQALREHYQIQPNLQEQLAEAVAAEDYERAARLRDELARKSVKRG